jgi:hypothetical protein
MDIGELKQRLQEHFTDGLVTIVGSGLSVAEGVPGMVAIADHLRREVPSRLSKESQEVWDHIAAELAGGTDLENTLLKHPPDTDLENVIVDLTARLILEAETCVVEGVIAGRQTLRFTRLLDHMLKPNTGIPVVTTNYDRLIEVAGEVAGLGVDTLFVGHHIGHLDSRQSQFSLCRGITQRKKAVHLTYANHLVVLKPHGSLDWYLQDNEPIRCPLPLSSQRLIITPGLNKFRGGYDRPFDTHRERANREIDNAARYLILGYGFNDDHLQTHLEHHLKKGKPAVLITRSLSDKARGLVAECDGLLAITADRGSPGSVVISGGKSHFLAGPDLWDLGIFVSEVLEP